MDGLLGDRYDKGATLRDRLIDRRLTTAAAAKKDYAASHWYRSSTLVGAHRYSNSNAVLVGSVELNATGSRYIRGYRNIKIVERQKKRHEKKKVTKATTKSEHTETAV